MNEVNEILQFTTPFCRLR